MSELAIAEPSAIIRSQLQQAFRRVSEWVLSLGRTGSGLVALFESFAVEERPQVLKQFFSTLFTPMTGEDSAKSGPRAIQVWLKNLLPILTWAKDEFRDVLLEHFRTGVDAEHYLGRSMQRGSSCRCAGIS